MNKVTLITFLLLLLVGCKQEADIVFPDFEVLDLYVYKNGVPVAEEKLAPGTPKHNKLKEWVNSNRTGWEMSMATYVPNVLVSGSDFSINFRSSDVVLNYKKGQYTKPIAQSNYQYLVEGIKHNNAFKSDLRDAARPSAP